MTQTLSLLSLFIISVFSYLASKKFNLPYTVLLVFVWILLVPISKIGFFSFINDFELTPNILFFVFLPVLLFEAAYNINYHQLLKNWKTIGILAIVWLLLSAIIVAFLLYILLPFVGLQIPFLVCLLFWILISATDPVAVLSIFKSMWAPRRLTIIFEWESLFNDGTAVALFLVILGIILEWWYVTSATYLDGILSFSSMLFGWILFWTCTWIIFSKVIGYINNNEEVEIALTLLLAHITFLLAELITHHFEFMPISWVIATVVASIIVWNYGRYKISPRVEVHMQKFWELFAFISNSIVFILMWLILSSLEIPYSQLLVPVLITIPIVVLARFISVYIPIWFINVLKLEERIPNSWQLLLSWWSLRWALALMMVLLIPSEWQRWYAELLIFQETVWWNFEFGIKDFLLTLTIWSIMFTLFIKATTIPFFMKKMGIDTLHPLELFEYEEWRIMATLKILEKLNDSYKKSYLTEAEYHELKSDYTHKLKNAVGSMKELLSKNPKDANTLITKVISLHALWIEKQYLKELFFYNELWEKNFKYILRKIEKQIERVDAENAQLRSISNFPSDYDVFSKFAIYMYRKTSTPVDEYIRNRARVIITRKVIKELRKLKQIDFWFDSHVFDEVIDLYAIFHKTADKKRLSILKNHRSVINLIESKLANKSLLKLEEKVLQDLYHKEMVSPKIYHKFMDWLELEMYRDIKKIM